MSEILGADNAACASALMDRQDDWWVWSRTSFAAVLPRWSFGLDPLKNSLYLLRDLLRAVMRRLTRTSATPTGSSVSDAVSLNAYAVDLTARPAVGRLKRRVVRRPPQ
ncbi:hypothetical protein ACFRCX_20535 [Streptomyces sp. NPDC056652]|uniref:hypothetical protein n=1 Tax=Streptomyces sp. NPDC056652 TaxID=3345893 RepID=UPI0036C8CE23